MTFSQFVAAQLRQPSGFFGERLLVPWLNRFNVPINRLALAEMELRAGDSVLEIGFGGGDLLRRAALAVGGGFVAGVDISAQACAAAARRLRRQIAAGRVELHCAAAEELPFAANSFSRVCSVNTLYFWADPPRVLAEARRVLVPAGRLVVCFNPRSLLERRRFTRHGFRLYEAEEVTALLAAAGFAAVRVNDARHRFGRCLAVSGSRPE